MAKTPQPVKVTKNALLTSELRKIRSYTYGSAGLRVRIRGTRHKDIAFVCDAGKDELNGLLSSVILAYASQEPVILQYRNTFVIKQRGDVEKQLVAIGFGTIPPFDT